MKEKMFKKARDMADLSTYKRQQVGCVVTYKGRIISTGYNQDKTDPLQKEYNKERNIPENCPAKLHAETHALKHIKDLDVDWSNVSVYLYRKRRDMPFGIARPCPSCWALIKSMGIRNVYYTTDEGTYIHEAIR